jgi:hypothetical protein
MTQNMLRAAKELGGLTPSADAISLPSLEQANNFLGLENATSLLPNFGPIGNVLGVVKTGLAYALPAGILGGGHIASMAHARGREAAHKEPGLRILDNKLLGVAEGGANLIKAGVAGIAGAFAGIGLPVAIGTLAGLHISKMSAINRTIDRSRFTQQELDTLLPVNSDNYHRAEALYDLYTRSLGGDEDATRQFRQILGAGGETTEVLLRTPLEQQSATRGLISRVIPFFNLPRVPQALNSSDRRARVLSLFNALVNNATALNPDSDTRFGFVPKGVQDGLYSKQEVADIILEQVDLNQNGAVINNYLDPSHNDYLLDQPNSHRALQEALSTPLVANEAIQLLVRQRLTGVNWVNDPEIIQALLERQGVRRRLITILLSRNQGLNINAIGQNDWINHPELIQSLLRDINFKTQVVNMLVLNIANPAFRNTILPNNNTGAYSDDLFRSRLMADESACVRAIRNNSQTRDGFNTLAEGERNGLVQRTLVADGNTELLRSLTEQYIGRALTNVIQQNDLNDAAHGLYHDLRNNSGEALLNRLLRYPNHRQLIERIITNPNLRRQLEPIIREQYNIEEATPQVLANAFAANRNHQIEDALGGHVQESARTSADQLAKERTRNLRERGKGGGLSNWLLNLYAEEAVQGAIRGLADSVKSGVKGVLTSKSRRSRTSSRPSPSPA